MSFDDPLYAFLDRLHPDKDHKPVNRWCAVFLNRFVGDCSIAVDAGVWKTIGESGATSCREVNSERAWQALDTIAKYRRENDLDLGIVTRRKGKPHQTLVVWTWSVLALKGFTQFWRDRLLLGGDVKCVGQSTMEPALLQALMGNDDLLQPYPGGPDGL